MESVFSNDLIMAKIATDLTLAELKRVRLLFSGVSYIVAREIVRRSVVTVPVWRDDDGGVWIDKEVTRWLNSVVVKRTRIYLNKNTPENVQGMKAAEFLEQARDDLIELELKARFLPSKRVAIEPLEFPRMPSLKVFINKAIEIFQVERFLNPTNFPKVETVLLRATKTCSNSLNEHLSTLNVPMPAVSRLHLYGITDYSLLSKIPQLFENVKEFRIITGPRKGSYFRPEIGLPQLFLSFRKFRELETLRVTLREKCSFGCAIAVLDSLSVA
ncbi:hypothetical protein Fcan01_17809, partial [Folsomia candida]